MSNIFTVAFLKALSGRAVRTFAQVLGALLVAGGTGLLDTDWGKNLSVAGMATLLSVLTSLTTGAVTQGNIALGGVEVIPSKPLDPPIVPIDPPAVPPVA